MTTTTHSGSPPKQEPGTPVAYSIGKTEGGSYSWWLYGDNRERVAWAAELFASEDDAHGAAHAFKTGASIARYEVYKHRRGEWGWRAWRSGVKVAASGEPFSSKSDAQRAVENVLRHACFALGPGKRPPPRLGTYVDRGRRTAPQG